MPTTLRRSLRITRRTCGYGFLIALIFAALLVSIANLFLPFIENNPERVKLWLSERVGQPVQFKQSHTEWTRRGPKISLTGLTIGKGLDAVDIGQADLLIAVYSGLLPNHPLTELKAKGLFLRLEQLPDDRWILLGTPKQKNSKEDALDVLSGFGELQLEQSILQVAPNNHAAITIPRIDLRLRVQGQKVSVGFRAEAKKSDPPLFLVAKLDRVSGSGKLWIGGSKLHIKQWLALFPEVRVPDVKSETQLDLWADIEQRRVMRLHSRIKIEDISINDKLDSSLVLDKADVMFDRINFESHWQRQNNGWQFYIPDITFKSVRGLESLDDIRISDDSKFWQAQAKSIPLNPLTRLMPLLQGQLPNLQSWLQKAAIQGDISAIKAHGNNQMTQWRVNGTGVGIGFNPVANSPGIDGLAGNFVLDNLGGIFRFEKQQAQLDWPVAFGAPIKSMLDGKLLWWRSGSDWVLAANNLHWQGDGLSLALDAQMQIYADQKSPMLNLAAKLAPFDFKTAKRFWLQHLMPKSTINWLNMALVKGQIRDATIQVAGDMSHWPFTDKQGRFSAHATVLAEQFKFAADWPVAGQTTIYTDFYGPGFSATGSTQYFGNSVTLKPSGIASFKKSELIIDVNSASEFSTLMPIIQNTPLKNTVGELVSSLQGKGAASADANMFFPLKQGAAYNRVDGNLRFQNTDIRSPSLALGMQKINGLAQFDSQGFAAKDLLGQMDGNPVRFNLLVGQQHTLNASNHVEAKINGSFHTDYLLKFDPSLADLKSVLNGTSTWQFLITVPQSKNLSAAPVFLSAQSSLVGTQIMLPIPLGKVADTSQSFSLNTQLPADRGNIEFRIGPQFRLMLKKPINKPIAGIALFGSQTQGAIPASGFSVRGATDEFDVAAWLTLAKKAQGGAGLQSFDLLIEHMRLLSEDFGATRLQLNPADKALSVRASGERFDGVVSIPDATSATVTARFAKVHFRQAGLPSKAVPAEASEPLNLGNPAELPPMQLSIDDLRVGNATLGRFELSTQPVKQGMQIQKFSIQSGLLSMSSSGLWQSDGKQDRTSLQTNLNAPDLGKLLSAFQYKDVISHGLTKARLTGAWPGTPMDFSLQAFNGNMDLDIGEGQIVGVEPGGGGRVLGLISLAELPRRLSLDFSDFTQKGFGFKSIKGQFSFSNGQANTQNLLIAAPAADIKITGNTDLVKQQFNQTVNVQPKTSGILPVVGAVVAGPIGAAAGVVAQAVLNKPMNETTGIQYQITGPWAEPVVTKSSNKKK